MKMKGILKQLATLTIMAALVLCLLPMMSMTAFAESNSATYTDGVYVLEVTNYDEYMQTGTHVRSIELLGIENVDISINTSNQIVCSFKLRFIDAIGQECTTDYSFSFTVENKICTEAISHSFEATYGKSSSTTYVVAKGTLTRAARTEHTGDATCIAKAKCSVCGEEYGEVNPDAHSWGDWTYSNGKHSRTCTLNGTHTESANCTRGENDRCTVCETNLVASLTSGSTVTYYGTADEAFAAAQAAGSGTVTVLDNAEYTREKPAAAIIYPKNISLVVNPNVTLTTKAFLRLRGGSISGGGTIAGTNQGWLIAYDGSTIEGITATAGLNIAGGTILSGTFAGEVQNDGTIKGGTFSGMVYNSGTIEGGTFSETVVNHDYYSERGAGTISGGTFNCTVENTPGTINGGTFNGQLTNKPYGEYESYVEATVDADNLTLGENFSFTNQGGTVTCNTHQRTTPATCMAPETCIFCGAEVNPIDTTAHNLIYSVATDMDNTITETCAHNGCTHSATATLDISTDSVTYNGAAQTIATVTHSGTWLGERLTAQYENNTNVGTATVYIQAGEAKAVKTFAINKATPTLEHFNITLPQNAVYDGEAKAATVIVKDGITGMGGIGIKYFQNDVELNETPTNAGTYTVKFKTASGDNYNQSSVLDAGTFTIAKADTIVTAPMAAAERFVYNGNPQLLTTAGTANGGYRVLYWMKTEDPYSENVLTATDAGTYTVKWYAGSHSDTNYNRNQGEITVTIEPATITVTPTANQSMTYGGTLPNLTFGGSGAASTETPAFTGALTIDGTKAGTYKIKKGTLALADDESTGFKASNYTLVVDETVDFVIKPRALTLTVEDQTITYGESIDQAEYTVEGLADGDKATVTLTPSTENITKSGKITAKVSVKNAANEDVTDCYTNTEMTATLTINPDLSAIKDLTVDNVHHSNEEDIKAVQDMLDKAEADVKNDQNITEAQQKCANLLVQIHKSLDALRTDAIEDTLGTTASNVKLADKATVTKAIDDIEKAKTNYAGNYSEADIAALDAQIANLEAALEAIKNAEAAIAVVNALPADVEPDDAKAIEAKEVYEKLTANEKVMVTSKAADKVAALTNYKIVKGNAATWETGKTLTFTINGDINRFKRVEVEGEPVNGDYYEVKSGSTIVTLNKKFFQQGKYTSRSEYELTFVFDDGSVNGTYKVHKDSMTPATGDTSGIVMWTVVLFASSAALAGLYIASRKKNRA